MTDGFGGGRLHGVPIPGLSATWLRLLDLLHDHDVAAALARLAWTIH